MQLAHKLSLSKKLQKSGVVTVDETDRIIRMTEKDPSPESNWVSVAFYYYPKEAIGLTRKALEEGCGVDAPGSLLIWMSQRMTSYAMQMPGNRFDVGDVASYQQVRESYRGICRED
jgi:glucose-1-phosphate thymidylyltransferase